MFMPFEIVSICVWLWYFFQKPVILQLIQIYECNQLHRYLLCVVVVIVCSEHWEQGIQIELTCNSKLFIL